VGNPRLEGVVRIQLTGLHCQQPRQVGDPAVAVQQLRPQWRQRRQQLAILEPLLLRFLGLAPEVQDHMVLGHRQGGWTARDAGTQVLEVHRGRRQAEHQPPAAPVGEVHVHVEIADQQLGRVGLEIAPVVLVEEPCRRDLGTRRNAPQLRHLRWRQRTVQGHELVILVLAHDLRAPFENWRRSSQGRNLTGREPGAAQSGGSSDATMSP
jgi:hypothetical protein